MIKSLVKEKKQLINLSIYGFGQGFNLLTPLLVAPYLIFICGEEGFGKIGVGMALSFFLIVIIDYGSDIVGVKDVSVNRYSKEGLEKILSTTYASKLVLLCVVIAAAGILFSSIPYFAKDKYLFFLGLPILIGQFINPSWVFQGIENYKAITAANIASKIIYAVGVFLTVKEAGDYIYVNMWWGLGMILAHGAAFIYLKKKYEISFRNTSKEEVDDFLKRNFPMFTSQIFVSLQLYSPIMIISFFAGDAMAGKYKIVEQIFGVFKTYLILFFNYVYPRICYLLENNRKEAMRFWKLCNGGNLVFIGMCMTLIFFMAEPIVAYFKPQSVDEVVQLLKFALLIPVSLAISLPVKQLLLGCDYQKEYVRITMVMVIVNLIMLTVLLTIMEIYGVLFSFVITEILSAVWYMAVIKGKLSTADKKV